MDTEAIKNLKNLQKRREIISALENKQIYHALKTSGKLTTGDVGDTDLGSELSEQKISLKLASMEDKELANIDRAISKIKNGTYGICESCGVIMEEKRMAAIPETNLCLECKSETNTQRDRRH